MLVRRHGSQLVERRVLGRARHDRRNRAVVRVAGIDRRGRREGALVEVLERNTKQLVGRFYLERGIGFLVPHNKRVGQDIVVPPEYQSGAANGQMVVVELIAQPSLHCQPIGKFIEILGDHMEPGMEIDIAARSYDLPQTWSEAEFASKYKPWLWTLYWGLSCTALAWLWSLASSLQILKSNPPEPR